MFRLTRLPIRFSTSFRPLGRARWSTVRFYSTKPRSDNTFRTAASKYQQMTYISSRFELAKYPYYNPLLMGHVKTYLPEWPGFLTEYRTYLTAQWSTIFFDWDWQTVTLVADEEQPLLQRDRLMQIFQACPEGSYGYFASKGLGPFKSVVGSFAAATIDEFFASNVQWLSLPYCDDLNVLMSELETYYWDNRQKLVEYLAGKTFTKKMRQWGVSTRVPRTWDGKSKPMIPGDEASEPDQMAAARVLLEDATGTMDAEALEKFSIEVYEKLVSKGKAAGS
jgi:hypothetical protein